ncbi:hypothetical protein GCM10009737_08150 [Nocardioides lentus]|uniref:Uncharacterized protein n=1 Tax=Nocardioides lentus TaxID=338077 RepID=A0ABN2P1W1_9ACTN
MADHETPDEQPAEVEQSPLDRLLAAVQDFANSLAGQPVLVDVALLVWEQVRYDEDGDIARKISYAIPTDNFSLSSGLGLLEAAGHYVRRDVLGARHTDEDDD